MLSLCPCRRPPGWERRYWAAIDIGLAALCKRLYREWHRDDAAWRGTTRNSPAQVAAARLDARAMNLGWVLVWPQRQLRDGVPVRFWNPGVLSYLTRTGFRFAYQADSVLVYQPTG
jgi:hypothetical protein